MHAPPRWVANDAARRRPARAVCALLCVTVVLLAHAAMWSVLSAAPNPLPGARAIGVQVRQITVVPAPERAAAAVVPAVAAQSVARTGARRSPAPARATPAPVAAVEPSRAEPASAAVDSGTAAAAAAPPPAATPLP